MAVDPRIIRVQIPGNEYDIRIRPGLLEETGAILRALTSSRKVALVTNDTVGPLYAGPVQASLRAAGFEVSIATLPDGEDHKTLANLSLIFDQVLRAGVERSTPLVALGGGVVGDMSGFAAASLLRGLPFIQVPTTLLSMVDASVGGKTGINHPVGKNLIGAFHQPRAVLIDPAVLRTLPPRELRGGLAECIKHDLIRDADGFARLEREIGRALSLDLDYLTGLIAHNVAIKARVVEADPFEKGERAHLNFGHTFGHAIETISSYDYSHGESVALGMVAAAECARLLDMIGASDVQRIRAILSSAGLPTGNLRLDIDQVVAAMIYDKKVKAGKVRFVLPDRIGHVVIRDDVPPETVRAATQALASPA